MASSNVEFRVLSIPDRKMVEVLTNVAKKLSASQAKLIVVLAPNGPRIELLASDVATDQALLTLLSYDGLIAHQMALYLPLGREGNSSITLTRNSDGFDQVRCVVHENLDVATAAGFIAATRRHLAPYDPVGRVDVLVGKELAAFYQQREGALLRLESLNEEIVKQSVEYRQTLDRSATELRSRLEDEARAHKQKLDEDHETRLSAIRASEDALAEEKRNLDDRSSRHARRAIRTDFLKKLEAHSQKFALTQSTARKRWPIHALFAVLTLGAAAYFGFALWDQAHAEFEWYRAIRVPATALAFAATLIFYIRWNDQWFQQHADEEFHLKQLELDFDRASWVVEMALEWRDEKGGDIPPEIVDRLSRNLFNRTISREAASHPSEDLLSMILGASSGMQLDVPGLMRAQLDRKGIRSLKRAREEREAE